MKTLERQSSLLNVVTPALLTLIASTFFVSEIFLKDMDLIRAYGCGWFAAIFYGGCIIPGVLLAYTLYQVNRRRSS